MSKNRDESMFTNAQIIDKSHDNLQAQEVMQKMIGNSETMAAYQSLTHEHYKETLNSLRQVNASVNFVISTVNSLQDGVYAKLGWLEIALGGTGDKVAFLKTGESRILADIWRLKCGKQMNKLKSMNAQLNFDR